MRSHQQRLLLIIGGTAIFALAVVVLLRPNHRPGPAPADNADQQSEANTDNAQGHADPQPAELYALGLQLLAENKLIEARSVLSRALLSERLTASQADDARDKLMDLANETLFSPDVYENDPYTFLYVVQWGDMLQRIERKLELHVPHTLIMKINGLPDDKIYADDTLKMIRGPFHAVINKSDFTMDIYLHREGLEKIFIARMEVGLGKNNGTPLGLWQVKLDGKGSEPTWYPPPRSHLQGPIKYGEPGYPFGKLGLWIPLVGIDENIQQRTGYGIHSTDKPESIGREASLGCIRLRDGDIEVVYTLLYEKWSTVEIRP